MSMVCTITEIFFSERCSNTHNCYTLLCFSQRRMTNCHNMSAILVSQREAITQQDSGLSQIRHMNPFHLAPDSELGTETRFIKLVLEVIKLCILMKERGKLQSCSFLIMCAQFGSSALCRSGNRSKGCTSIKAARAERVKTLSTQSFSEKCAAFCLFTGTCCCHQAASFVFRREL